SPGTWTHSARKGSARWDTHAHARTHAHIKYIHAHTQKITHARTHTHRKSHPHTGICHQSHPHTHTRPSRDRQGTSHTDAHPSTTQTQTQSLSHTHTVSLSIY